MPELEELGMNPLIMPGSPQFGMKRRYFDGLFPQVRELEQELGDDLECDRRRQALVVLDLVKVPETSAESAAQREALEWTKEECRRRLGYATALKQVVSNTDHLMWQTSQASRGYD